MLLREDEEKKLEVSTQCKTSDGFGGNEATKRVIYSEKSWSR